MIRKIVEVTKPYVPYIPFAAVAIVMVAVVAFALFRLARPPEPPIHYTQEEYTPNKAVYEPGQSMVYSPTLVIRVPGRVNVLRSFWDRTNDRNAVLCSGQSAPVLQVSRNFPPTTIGNVRSSGRVQLLIPDLPPGEYWLLSSASGPDGGQSQYAVPFSIRKECG